MEAAEALLQYTEPKQRQTGVVIWFDNSKGYGFIQPRDGGGNVFVHQSEIRTRGFRTLSPDQPVEYDVEDHIKGPRAVNVCPQE